MSTQDEGERRERGEEEKGRREMSEEVKEGEKEREKGRREKRGRREERRRRKEECLLTVHTVENKSLLQQHINRLHHEIHTSIKTATHIPPQHGLLYTYHTEGV